MKPRNARRNSNARKTGTFLLGSIVVACSVAEALDLSQDVTFASPAIIDPSDTSLNIISSSIATNSTPKETLEAMPGFRVIQNFAGVASPNANQSLVNNFILNATDSPTTPDIKISYFVGPDAEDVLAANTWQIGSNISFQSSLGSSIRMQGANFNSALGIRIEAGSWDGATFTSGVVAGMGFTVVGPVDRMVADSVTVTYHDASDNILSTQVITSTVVPVANIAGYTGHQVTSGPLIKYARVSFKGATASTVCILGVDDIGFAPDPSSAIAPLKWAVGNGDWDTTTANWQPLAGGAAMSYTEGADVTFDDSASGTSPITVNLVNARTPATINVSGAKDYILADGGGEITGGGSLAKSGSGTLVLGTDNTFTGPTILTEGNIRLDRSGALQNSGVTLGGGSFMFAAAAGPDFSLGSLAAALAGPGYDVALQDNAVSPAAINLTVGMNGLSTNYAGVLSGPGSLVKDGAGTLTLSNANTYAGDTTLQGTGVLRLANANAVGTTGTLNLNSTQTSPGVATVEINGGIVFSRPIAIDSTTGREHFTSTGGANTLSSPVTINYTGANTISFDAAGGTGNVFTVSGNIDAPDYIGTLALRGTSGGLLTGVINAPSAALDIIQAAANVAWTISSTGNSWAVTRMSMGANGTAPNETGFPGGRIILGANDALCPTARMFWPNTSNNIAGGTLDLAGFSQTVAGLDKPNAHPNDTPNSIPNITNSSASQDSTLTLQDLTQDYSYTGSLSDGPTRKLKLTLNSPGRIQRLTRAPAYTGNTTIVDGTLRVDIAGFADTSTVQIGTAADSPAILNLPAGGTDTIAALVIDGVSMAIGEYGPIASGAQFETDAITGFGRLNVIGASAYDAWKLLFPGFTNNAPDDDHDMDGLVNQQEFAFGLDPTSGASVSPITGGLPANGQFSYTRWADSGLTYKVFTSTSLMTWTEDVAASNSQVPGPAGANGVQSVAVTLSATPVDGKLFVRIKAD
jgi:autotransporter-associated beta strand protein